MIRGKAEMQTPSAAPTRARELLGYEPRVSLEEGLQHTIDYFKAELGVQ